METTAPEDRLVLFDCDGVLVDSEPISISVLCETVAEAGLAIPVGDAYARWLGRSLSTVVDDMEATFGLVVTDGDLERMRAHLFARFRAELRAIPHVAAAIGALGARVCVASSSSPERIALSLEVTGLATLFGGDVFSASMVAEGKPAPDLFLFAAARMRFPPRRCVVVEDSPAGIVAARAAGMAVVAYAGGSHAGPAGLRAAVERLSPDAVVDDMRHLPGAIAAIA